MFSGRDKFDNVGQNFIVPQLLGGGDSVVAIQNVESVLDLVELHRRQGGALLAWPFDALQASEGTACFIRKRLSKS